MSKNPYGAITKGSREWGRKARKHEDRERGIPARADEQVISEQLAEMDEARAELEAFDAAEAEEMRAYMDEIMWESIERDWRDSGAYDEGDW